MGGRAEVADAAYTYLAIRLLGGPPLLVTMAALGGLRGVHDMRTPLWIALGTNLANLVLDPLLIFGAGPVPALGVAGAAWATVASQWGGGAAALWCVRRRLGRPERIVWREAGQLLVVGRDLFLRTAMLIAFLQHDPLQAVLVAVGYLVLALVLGNLLEPALMGRRLGLSTLAVFLSLLVWGWLWGPMGLILATPLLMMTKTLCDHVENLQGLGELLGK